jgi:syntaxin-binding protein 1
LICVYPFQLCSVLVALGEYPQIRYFSSSKVQFGKLLADLVQKEVDEYGRIDSSYPPPSNFSPAIMLILDRSLDAATPLVHEFTYQAMIQDLLPLENGKYKYEPDNGPPALITLDENDSVWVTLTQIHD